jgi:hypothetical protein
MKDQPLNIVYMWVLLNSKPVAPESAKAFFRSSQSKLV